MMNEWKEIKESDVIGYCANSECMNDFTEEDEYLYDEYNHYCDSICYTKYMISHGVVIDNKY